MDYIDLLVESKEIREKYIKNINKYLKLIKRRANKILGKDSRLIVFGSFLNKEKFKPTSDIDILIISKNIPQELSKRAEILLLLKKDFNTYHPFEIHLATPEIYENWYKKFIKDEYIEI